MRIGLLGHGVVGRGVTEILDRRQDGLAEVVKILVKDLGESEDARHTVHAEEIVEDPSIDLVVECMGGLEPAHTLVRTALASGKSAVTSNKKMFAAYQKELRLLAAEQHASLCCEACVGGGIPWIHEIGRTRRIDEISSFRGILNGTTNQILYGMAESGAGFAEMLKEAQRLGYAEQDPSDDIDGMDVRYKVCISIAEAFDLLIDPVMIPAFGIRHITAGEISWAAAQGRTVKLIGRACMQDGRLAAAVMPMMLKGDDPFSKVPLNFNEVELNGTTLGPAAFYGQGAGSLPTAHAVVQDILDIAQGRAQQPRSLKEGSVDLSGSAGVYYVRTAHPELYAGMKTAEVMPGAFLTDRIALSEIAGRAAQDDSCFLAEVA